MRNTFLIMLFFYGTFKMISQDNFTLLFEPEISIGYKVSENYSQSFSIENRNFIYKDSHVNYAVKHVEIGHLSEYAILKNTKIGLGFQYRFQENFNPASENEFRLVQRVSWKSKRPTHTFEHTLRNEQRFYNSTTKDRMRYKFGVVIPLHEQSNYLKTETESLLEVGKLQKPKFEQRLAAVYGWNWSSQFRFESGFEYRLANFTQDLGHELFLVANLKIEL